MEEKITFFGALGRMWGRIFNYKDTATRKEYWFPFIFHFIIAALAAGLMFLSLTMESGNLYYCLGAFALLGYLCFSVIPWISLTVRRLRDAGKSGWWTLLILVIGVGSLILLLLCTSASAFYNAKGGSGFNPIQNEIPAVYGPPEMFDPSQNEMEEIYGPPEMLDPINHQDDELNDEPIIDPDEANKKDDEETKDDQKDDDMKVEFDEKKNMEPVVYGPPEMLEAIPDGASKSEAKTEEKAVSAESEEPEEVQMTLDDLVNQEEDN